MVPPFPPEIDRAEFGAWLSGFIDGEGCFSLQMTRWKGRVGCFAALTISLRDDDEEVLALIRSYWQCGNISKRRAPQWTERSSPQARYTVSGWTDSSTIVLPHFDRFPLLSKKRYDFEIWREAVLFAKKVSERPTVRKWLEEDLCVFEGYATLIKMTREYPSLPYTRRIS